MGLALASVTATLVPCETGEGLARRQPRPRESCRRRSIRHCPAPRRRRRPRARGTAPPAPAAAAGRAGRTSANSGSRSWRRLYDCGGGWRGRGGRGGRGRTRAGRGRAAGQALARGQHVGSGGDRRSQRAGGARPARGGAEPEFWIVMSAPWIVSRRPLTSADRRCCAGRSRQPVRAGAPAPRSYL